MPAIVKPAIFLSPIFVSFLAPDRFGLSSLIAALDQPTGAN
jgi:hypothetical protein